MPRRRAAVRHPGIILLKDFLRPYGISQRALAAHLQVPPTTVSLFIHGKRSVTVEMAQRLAQTLGTTPHFWLYHQIDYDLATHPTRVHLPRLWAPGRGSSTAPRRSQQHPHEDAGNGPASAN